MKRKRRKEAEGKSKEGNAECSSEEERLGNKKKPSVMSKRNEESIASAKTEERMR